MSDDLAIHMDFETASTTDLKKSGVYRYAEDPHTRVWGFAYWFTRDDNPVTPVRQWRPGYPDPQDLLDHVARGGKVVIHNAAFERTIWNVVVRGRYCPHWPVMTITQQDCVMSRAAAVALPQKLEKLGEALGTNMRKDMEGHKVMMKMARPRGYAPDGSVLWWDAPDLLERNMAYCEIDVRVETQASKMVPPLTAKERAVWEFDQVINERGVAIDAVAVERAAQLVEYTKKQLDKIAREWTNRAVSKTSKDREIIAWLQSRGVNATSLAKGEIEDVIFLAGLAGDELAHNVIRLRQAGWKTSTAKYRAMQACVSWDKRIRGMLNYYGASTGRWAGRLVQPQNFRRVDPDDKVLAAKIAWMVQMLGDARHDIKDIYDACSFIYGPIEVMDLLSSCLRSMLVAAPDKRLVGGDFSNIEGRVNAWLGDEMWKLQAFRDYDMKIGEDLYKLAYARSFNVDVSTVGKGPKRQIGKVQELALGFQGSVGAYIGMGANYGVSPYDLSNVVLENSPTEQWDRTAKGYHKRGVNKYDLPEKEWTALKILVDNWRAAHPGIVGSWWEYQDAAIEAVSVPGTIVSCARGRVSYFSDQRNLWCTLPSGSNLCYHMPELVETVEEYETDSGEIKERTRRKVVCWGTDSVTKQWVKYGLYGGFQCENIVQATARDIMVHSMFAVEHAGYPIILTVHDELLSEVDDWRRDLNEDHFASVMSQLPHWAEGLPVAVGAWEDYRYVK